MSISAQGQGTPGPANPATAQVAPASVPQAADQSPLAKAEQLYRTGKLAEAAQEYNALLQAEPKSVMAYVGLVHVYLRQKKPSEAYAAAAKAIELAPSLDAAHVALGEACFRQGKLSDAEKEFADLVKAKTKEPRAYLGLWHVYTAASYFKHAKVMIDLAYSLDPKDPDIRSAWARTLTREEHIKELKAYLSSDAGEDTEERERLEHYLAVLDDEAGRPMRPCRLATKLGPMETNLEQLLIDPTHIRGYGLRVNLNGASSRLLLDTGASGILVDRKIAEKAGIQRVLEQKVRGIGDKGPASGYIGYADSIKIGDLEFKDCYVEAIDKNPIGEDGLIGADVFSRFLVDIDFPNSKFRLSPLPPRPDESATPVALESRSTGVRQFHDPYVAPEMKSFTPVFRFGHNLLIYTRLNDLPPKLFLIDTGAFNNTISPAAAREVTKVSSDSDLKVRGLSGSVKNVFRADELTLQFGHLRQKNLNIVAFDTKAISDADGTEVSGFLGFAMLRMLRIRIDYRDGLVDCEFDRNRFH
jgi:tetratricopeptide (TPR) repeat protein